MKKLYVSNYIGFDESATKATLYSFDDERCQVFNVFDESSNYGVLPGAAYHTYRKKSAESFSNYHIEFVVVGGILTLYDTLALNV